VALCWGMLKNTLNDSRMNLDSETVAAAGLDDRIAVLAPLFRSKQSFHFFEAVAAKVNCGFVVSDVMVLVAKAPAAQDVVAEVPHLAQGGSALEGHLLEKVDGKMVEVAGQGKHQVELARREDHAKEARVVCC
jgi:hypothetical protein